MNCSTRHVTCYDLSQLWVQVDGAGQEGPDVSGRQDGRPGRQEDLEAPNVSVYLQQRLHVLGGGDVLGHSETRDTPMLGSAQSDVFPVTFI